MYGLLVTSVPARLRPDAVPVANAPGSIAADARGQHVADDGQRALAAPRVDPGVLLSASFTTHIVALLGISTLFCPLRRRRARNGGQ